MLSKGEFKNSEAKEEKKGKNLKKKKKKINSKTVAGFRLINHNITLSTHVIYSPSAVSKKIAVEKVKPLQEPLQEL